MKIDTRAEDVVYITIGDWKLYLDNSTGEKIIEQWSDKDERCTICNKLYSSRSCGSSWKLIKCGHILVLFLHK